MTTGKGAIKRDPLGVSMAEGPVSAAELARAIERWTGIDPLTYADERIAKLRTVGDEASLRRITEMATRLDPVRAKDATAPD